MKLDVQTLSHRVFEIGIVLKGLDGLLEAVAGAALLFTTQPAIQHVVRFLTREELIEDPHDFLANLLVHLSQDLSIQSRHFAGIYLLGHGIVKVGLVVGLLRRVAWSYPAALLFLSVLIGYQLHRIALTHSLALTLFTVFDTVIVGLIWHEWRHTRPQDAG